MKVYFFYPSKIIGGAEYLFLNIANKLSETTNYEVSFIDYSHGFTESRLSKTINWIEYIPGRPIVVPNDSVIVVQLNLINKLNDYFVFQGNYYPLCWGINPYNLVRKVKLLNKIIAFKSFRKSCGSLIKRLIETGNILLMDKANLIALESTFIFHHTPSMYVPVPIDESRIKDNFTPSDLTSETVRFSWLGRLELDKIPTLITFMNEIEEYNKTRKSSLSIIGNGTQYDFIKKIINKYNYDIKLVGQLVGDQLDNFIDSNVDIGIAMGTSILEYSKRGVPVILKGFMEKPMHSGHCKDYLVTDEIDGFSLGSIDGIELKNPLESSFRKKVDDLLADYKIRSKKCYDYVISNHTRKTSTKLFEKAIIKLLDTNDVDTLTKLSDKFDIVERRKNKVVSSLRIIKFLYRWWKK